MLRNNSGTDRVEGEPAMDFIGFDLGKVSSQICLITADGELLEHRIKMRWSSFTGHNPLAT
jgi:hypothetical protein